MEMEGRGGGGLGTVRRNGGHHLSISKALFCVLNLNQTGNC